MVDENSVENGDRWLEFESENDCRTDFLWRMKRTFSKENVNGSKKMSLAREQRRSIFDETRFLCVVSFARRRFRLTFSKIPLVGPFFGPPIAPLRCIFGELHPIEKGDKKKCSPSRWFGAPLRGALWRIE